MLVRILAGMAAAGVAAILVVAHEFGAYIDDVYDHEAWWSDGEEETE